MAWLRTLYSHSPIDHGIAVINDSRSNFLPQWIIDMLLSYAELKKIATANFMNTVSYEKKKGIPRTISLHKANKKPFS